MLYTTFCKDCKKLIIKHNDDTLKDRRLYNMYKSKDMFCDCNIE